MSVQLDVADAADGEAPAADPPAAVAQGLPLCEPTW